MLGERTNTGVDGSASADQSHLKASPFDESENLTDIVDAPNLHLAEIDRSRAELPAFLWPLMIPDVLSAPDRIDYFGGASSGRPPMFGILKRINGHVLLVEETRTGRNTLAVISMRKFQAPR